MAELRIIGLEDFKRAIKRNPRFVVNRVNRYLVQGMAAYNRGILRSPWQLGNTSGGGAPVNTGNLRDTHIRTISRFEARIGPNVARAPYALYVHDGTRRIQARPWLDFVYRTKSREIERYYQDMLKDIVKDLAR